jgi:hypothetical protein
MTENVKVVLKTHILLKSVIKQYIKIKISTHLRSVNT